MMMLSQVIHDLTHENFDDVVFAAKSYFDLENFSMMWLLRLSNVLTKNIFDDGDCATSS